jgi:hypothetical protein
MVGATGEGSTAGAFAIKAEDAVMAPPCALRLVAEGTARITAIAIPTPMPQTARLMKGNARQARSGRVCDSTRHAPGKVGNSSVLSSGIEGATPVSGG